jgi:hypothetical protein
LISLTVMSSEITEKSQAECMGHSSEYRQPFAQTLASWPSDRAQRTAIWYRWGKTSNQDHSFLKAAGLAFHTFILVEVSLKRLFLYPARAVGCRPDHFLPLLQGSQLRCRQAGRADPYLLATTQSSLLAAVFGR